MEIKLLTKFTISREDCFSEKKLSKIKTFIGKGLTLKDIFCKQVPKSYPNYFRTISFRKFLLDSYLVQNEGVYTEKISACMEKHILIEIDYVLELDKKCSYYSVDYRQKCVSELSNLREYFLKQNKIDRFTFFSSISRALGVQASGYWDLYEIIANYNYLHSKYFHISSDFINHCRFKKEFWKELAASLGIESEICEIKDFGHIYL